MVTDSGSCLSSRRNGVTSCICHPYHRERMEDVKVFARIKEITVDFFPSLQLGLQLPCAESNKHKPGWVLDIGPSSETNGQSTTNRYSMCAQAQSQDGCHVQLCGCLLARVFLQSISQLIEIISITKSFLLGPCTPFNGMYGCCAQDSLCN